MSGLNRSSPSVGHSRFHKAPGNRNYGNRYRLFSMEKTITSIGRRKKQKKEYQVSQFHNFQLHIKERVIKPKQHNKEEFLNTLRTISTKIKKKVYEEYLGR
jgi:hypothetical protein